MENASSMAPSDTSLPDLIETRGFKRMKEQDEDPSMGNKRSRTLSVECGDQAEEVKDGINKSTELSISEDQMKEQVKVKFHCTACSEEIEKVYAHPMLKVIICISCKRLMEEKMDVKVWALVKNIFLIEKCKSKLLN